MSLRDYPDNVQLVVTKRDLRELFAEFQAANCSLPIAVVKDYYTHQQAAAYLGIASQTLYALTSRREIPYHKRGGEANCYLHADLEAWLLKNRKPSQEELADQNGSQVISSANGQTRQKQKPLGARIT
jgi:excisionase family DNA binding protein